MGVAGDSMRASGQEDSFLSHTFMSASGAYKAQRDSEGLSNPTDRTHGEGPRGVCYRGEDVYNLWLASEAEARFHFRPPSHQGVTVTRQDARKAVKNILSKGAILVVRQKADHSAS